MHGNTHRFILSLILGLLLLNTRSAAQSFSFASIDVHCDAATTCPAGLIPGQVASQTGARGINARGDIVGFYVAAGKQHGFLLKDGQFTSIDFPVANVRATIANGINPQGEIVGQYTLPVNSDPNVSDGSPLHCPPNLPTTPPSADPACIKGFFYRHGKFSTVMFPNHPGAIAQRITPDGDIYGCLHDHDLGMSMFGAVWTRFDTASLTANGGETIDPMPIPMSMNNGATPGGGHMIGGLWVDMGNQQHGLLVQGGVFQSYDPTSAATLTAIWDMDPSQQFVGTYRVAGEPGAKRHGFLQLPATPDGGFPAAINVDFPGAFATIVFGINPDGQMVGQYTLVSGGPAHGFAAVPTTNN